MPVNPDHYMWELLSDPSYVDGLNLLQLRKICQDYDDLGMLIYTLIAMLKKTREELADARHTESD